jgi:hypothetical protein
MLQVTVLTHFLHANRQPLRLKMLSKGRIDYGPGPENESAVPRGRRLQAGNLENPRGKVKFRLSRTK